MDHPRGCGENDPVVPGENAAAGSPPRMRGKLVKICPCTVRARITPADAGKTSLARRQQFHHWDHPRGCGENDYVWVRGTCPSGSPPRMRGKRHRSPRSHRKSRITPADAGKTHRPKRLSPHTGDHPRGCGENLCCTIPTARSSGSPPRMRGKHRKQIYNQSNNGITPADAGKTAYTQCGGYEIQDHPRGCGENLYCRKTDTV